MARLSRLSVAEQAHWLMQRGLPGRPVFADDQDRQAYLAALRDTLGTSGVRLHGFALCADAVHLVLTPAHERSPSLLMQALGRRYVSAHHRRHGGSGTLWDGRFRSTVVEAGAPLLTVLQLVDGLAREAGHSSGGHRSGRPEQRVPLVDPPELWTLGNTPFERETVWRQRLDEGLPAPHRERLLDSVRHGWVIGSPAFAARLAEQLSRPTLPRRRGRPPASSAAQRTR